MRRTRTDAIEALVVGITASALLFVRIPQASRNFWTDDGAFFQDAHNHGVVVPFAHFYNGYLHTLIRALAAVSAAFPIRRAPAVLFVLTGITIGWCAATAFLASRPWIVSVAGRLAMAVSIVALPSFGRANIGSAAFLQFTMLFVALLVLLQENDSKWITANSCAFLVTVGLSSLLAVALLPALFWRAVHRRRFLSDAVTMSLLAATAVQVIAIAVGQPARPVSHLARSLRAVASGYVYNVVSDNVAPPSSTFRPALILGGVVLSVVVGSAVVAAVADRALSTAGLLVGVPALGLLVYTLSGVSQGVAERYTVFPALCLAWAVITSTDYLVVQSRQVMPSARPVIATVVASLVLFGWVSGWRPSPIRTSGATWSDSLERGARQCTHRAAGSEISLPIAPAGWFVHLHCSDVRRLG